MALTKRGQKIYKSLYKGKQNHEKEETRKVWGGFGSRVNLLNSAMACWMSMSDLRKNMIRFENYVYGDQFSDRVYDRRHGRSMTEREMYRRQGIEPNQYNIIRGIVRSIMGVWISGKSIPQVIAQIDEGQKESDILTATLQSLYRKQERWKQDMAQGEQLSWVGLIATEPGYYNRDGEREIFNDYIDPHAFFVDNTMKDPTYRDCTLVGYYGDYSIEDVVAQFSHGEDSRELEIRAMYGKLNGGDDERVFSRSQTFTDERLEKDFLVTPMEKHGMCRVIKVWRKENRSCYWVDDRITGHYYPDYDATEAQLRERKRLLIERELQNGVAMEDVREFTWSRKSTDQIWRYYYLTPSGVVLEEGDNPYWHGKCPIVFEMHTFVMGKVYPFVSDLVDVNKQINSMSALSKLMVSNSAKNLLLMPRKTISEDHGYGMDYLQEEITRPDAIIPYEAGPAGSAKPEFISNVAEAFSPLNFINTFLGLGEKISGVYGGMQGQMAPSGISAQLYAQASQNSAISLNTLFESINSFRVRLDTMNVSLMQQFYDEKRYVYSKKDGRNLVYEKDRVRHLPFEVSVVENTDTPSYREYADKVIAQLKQYDQQGLLDLKGIVEMSTWPFKDKLLDYLNKREKQQEDMAAQGEQGEQGMPMAMPEELQQEIGQYQFTPEVQEKLQQLPEEVRMQMISAAEKGAGIQTQEKI